MSQAQTRPVLSTAIKYIQNGLRCVPVIPYNANHIHRGKAPAIKDWQTLNLSVEEFKSHHKGGNLGVITGKASNLVVIDIDADGISWYENNKDSLGNYLLEKTGSGGYHLYFQYPALPERINSLPSVIRLFDGVDFLADGGRQVVTWPSVHATGGTYDFLSNCDLTDLADFDPLPEWILTLVLNHKSLIRAPETLNGHHSIALDNPQDISRAIEYLKSEPGAIQGQAGDHHTYRVICKVKDFGLSANKAMELLTLHWNNKCNPPWESKGLQSKVQNAYKYSQNPIPVESTANLAKEFEATEAPKSTKALKVVPINELLEANIPKREHLIGPFTAQGLSMVFAPPGVGKTFFALSLSFAIATGTNFLNWRTEKRQKVLYIDGELPAYVLQERLAALIAITKDQKALIPPDFNDYLNVLTPDFQPEGLYMPDLGSQDGQKAILEVLKATPSEFIVLDNLSTLIRSGKENEAESWAPVQSFLLRLRSMGKSVLLVHHSGKGENPTQRGTSKREDALDLIIALHRPKGLKVGQQCAFDLKFTKVRHFRSAADVAEISATYSEFGWSVETLEKTTEQRAMELYEQGFTQRDICEKLDLSKGYVSKLLAKMPKLTKNTILDDDNGF